MPCKQTKQASQTAPAPLCFSGSTRKQHAKTAPSTDRPARGPRRPIHQQPRRRWALSSTAELALRPPTCGCSTGPRTSRPRAAPPRPEPSAEGEGTQHAAAQSTGTFPARQMTASRAAHNKRKQAFAYKCDAHRAYCCEACGTAVRDERLADFVLRNNSTAEQGVRGGGGWC